MLSSRVIPCLLLDGRRLVKTVRFGKAKYVGDPINAVKIFNDKFVDEIIFLDISASSRHGCPDFDLIAEITSECFIPFCYGGGVRTVEDAARLFSIGVEKVSVNSAIIKDLKLVSMLAGRFGSQSVVAAMDIDKDWLGRYHVMANRGKTKTAFQPVEYAALLSKAGVGEILVNSVDRDGTQKGYDVEILRRITDAVSVPVIGCGGAGSLEDVVSCVKDAGVSAAAAGSLFVFKGKHRAVLISYPDRKKLKVLFD